MVTHKCPVANCPMQIRMTFSFCREHWSALPYELRREVQACGPGAIANEAREQAVRAARKWIEAKEMAEELGTG